MKTQKTFAPKAPPAVTATRASQLCALRAELDEERLELDRAARAIEGEIKSIERQLIAYAKDGTGDSPIRDVPRYQIAVVKVPGFFSYKDTLIGEIGFEEFERRRLAAPKKDDLQITELRPATSKRVTEAREKAAKLMKKAA